MDNMTWRDNEHRWSHFGLLSMLHAAGEVLSPIWSFPFLQSKNVRYDWLHIVDKRVGNFFVAGLLDWVIHSLEWGPNQETRVAEIYRRK